jgi:hypothetical protein
MTPKYSHDQIEIDGVLVTDDGYVLIDDLEYVAHIVWSGNRWRMGYIDNWMRLTYKQNQRILGVVDPHLALLSIATRLTS